MRGVGVVLTGIGRLHDLCSPLTWRDVALYFLTMIYFLLNSFPKPGCVWGTHACGGHGDARESTVDEDGLDGFGQMFGLGFEGGV